jgi:Flp pilus assembly protein TadB
MKKIHRIYISLSKILPKPYIRYFNKLLRYAGEESDSIFHLGSSVLLSFLLAIIVYMSCYLFTTINIPIILIFSLLTILGVQILLYLIYYFKAESRADSVENYLPDQLQLMANNLKSGMSPIDALNSSLRDEFGALTTEMKIVVKKSYGAQTFHEAILKTKDKIKSVILERVLKLQSASIRTGGNLANLLTELATDIRQNQALKRDLMSKTKTYTAFILFTVLLGTPLLLSISIHFVDTVSGFSGLTESTNVDTDSFGLEIFSGGETISSEFLVKFSYFVLVITTILASLLLGVIQKGKSTSGLRYAIPLMAVVLIIFTLTRHGFASFFG